MSGAELATALDEWHPAVASDEVPDGGLRRVVVGGRAVCVGHAGGDWVAFDDACTHEECSLAGGELEGTVVVCPCHGSEFDIRTGDVLCPPAVEPLQIYEAREEAGSVLVRLAAPAAAAEAVHEREDHVPEALARQATVATPSTEGLALEDVDLTDLDVWERGVPHDWLALTRGPLPPRSYFRFDPVAIEWERNSYETLGRQLPPAEGQPGADAGEGRA